MSSDFGKLDNMSVPFGSIELDVGVGPFDGIVMKISDIITNQQVFTYNVDTIKNL